MFDLPNPYEHFDAKDLPDLQGWGHDTPVFRELITRIKPKLIVEVGTWKGASAIAMAEVCDELGLDTKIICIDTWLGAMEMWTDVHDEDRFLSLRLQYGYPTLYYTFLNNVVNTGHKDRIFPLPMTSAIGARFLWTKKTQADMIYIDASHDYEDVVADIRAYWGNVRKGGVMFGDDYSTWDGVKRAVHDSGIPFSLAFGDRNWIMEKP